MKVHLQGLIKDLQKQARHPAANDTYIHLFFRALLNISKKDTEILNSIHQAQKKREKDQHFLTNIHAIYLFTHIVNYLMIFFENNPSYPYEEELHLNTQEGWEYLINFLYKKYKNEVIKLLLEKDLQQNIPQRGVAMPFFVNTILLGKKHLKIADFGCSANFVWSSLMAHRPFPPIFDETKNNLISKYADELVDVGEFVGIDYNYPLTTEAGKKWILACRHPKEVKVEFIQDAQELLNSFKSLPGVKIVEQTFLNTNFQLNYFDIITFNCSLYQTPQNKQFPTLAHAEQFLNKTAGLLIVQDYCKVLKINGKNTLFLTDERNDYSFRTCIGGPIVKRLFNEQWLEIFRFKNTRCTYVKSGGNYRQYLKQLHLT